MCMRTKNIPRKVFKLTAKTVFSNIEIYVILDSANTLTAKSLRKMLKGAFPHDLLCQCKCLP